MTARPSVLCPVDFSEASRGALRYAAAIGEHFFAGLTVLAVNDRILSNAADARFGRGWLERRTAQELEQFVKKSFPGRTPQLAELESLTVTGHPAEEILRVASETQADLIVMSTHGASGVRKAMFGSTTARVLSKTTIPVIVSPSHDPGPDSLEDWRKNIGRLLVPVDLSHYSKQQVQIAQGLADALGASVTLVHVLEPVTNHLVSPEIARNVAVSRREMAATRLGELAQLIPPDMAAGSTVVCGDPATEIARAAREQSAGAIVMALHGALDGGPRMGSVTYRVLCEAPVLVVAWPPARFQHRLRFERAIHGDSRLESERSGVAV